MRRRMLITIDAPPDRVRDVAHRTLGVEPDDDGTLTGPLPGAGEATAALRLDLAPGREHNTTDVALEATSNLRVPYFGWAFGPILSRARRRAVEHAAARLRAVLAGEPEPRWRRSMLVPPVPFTPEAATLVATVAAIAAIANFGVALFGQNADSITDSFGASNRELGFALAISRVGVLVSLVASALADRRGRRRLLLACFAGACVMNALSAIAPGFIVFTGAQLMTRALVNAALVVAAIAVIEEAPEGARAWSLAMLALAGGAGFAIAVVLLPLSDLGEESWRIAFGASALGLLLLPRFARSLEETRRYVSLAARATARGRFREVFAPVYGWRFALVALAGFLVNVLNAPSAQLTNRFLTDEHGFSNTAIALFRTATNGLPGLFGIVLAGWLAENRGRRPVGIIALAVASGFQIAFFLGSGATLWLASTVSIVAAACAGLALVAFDTELFPTEVRGTSNALFLVCSVAGSATGLLLATNLDGPLGGLGPAIAVLAIAPIVAAFLVLPWLPEARARPLDDVSPSEV